MEPAKMFEVHWKGTKDGKRVNETHGKFKTYTEAFQSIRNWWQKNDFEPPYVRKWTRGNVTVLDYGSHVCFYEIWEINA